MTCGKVAGWLGLVALVAFLGESASYAWPRIGWPGKGDDKKSDSGSSGGGEVVTGKDFKNPVSEKWYDFSVVSGNYECKPKGLLKTLLDKPMGCESDLAKCKAGFDALRGKLDPAAHELFLDLIKMWPDKRNSRNGQFMMYCGQLGPRQDLWRLGLSGLGFVGTSQDLAEVLKLGDPEFLTNNKADFVRVLWFMGAKEAIPDIMKIIEAKGYGEMARVFGLEYLARWHSDAAVDWCTEALKSDAGEDTRKACVIYLGKMKATKATPLIVRNIEKYGELGIRALGQMGDPNAVQPLEEMLAKYQPGQYNFRIPIIAALINLGKTNYMKELLGYITKAEAGAREAAMEAVVISNPKVAGQVKAALAAAAKKGGSGGDWQPRIYAAIALAQLGDAQAIPILVKGLAGSNGEIRDAIVDAIGADENPFGAAFWRRGTGIVANKDLIPALLDYYDVETDKDKRYKALVAALHIRAITR